MSPEAIIEQLQAENAQLREQNAQVLAENARVRAEQAQVAAENAQHLVQDELFSRTRGTPSSIFVPTFSRFTTTQIKEVWCAIGRWHARLFHCGVVVVYHTADWSRKGPFQWKAGPESRQEYQPFMSLSLETLQSLHGLSAPVLPTNFLMGFTGA